MTIGTPLDGSHIYQHQKPGKLLRYNAVHHETVVKALELYAGNSYLGRKQFDVDVNKRHPYLREESHKSNSSHIADDA